MYLFMMDLPAYGFAGCCNQAWLLKNSVIGPMLCGRVWVANFFFRF